MDVVVVSLLQPLMLIAAVSMSAACGSEDKALAGPCSSGAKAAEPAPKAATETKVAASGDGQAWTDALTKADLAGYGKQIFLAKGSNTCNDCHGKDGKKGRIEQAANLTDPASWDATKALGGDAAKIDVALTYLVGNGGKNFNDNFEKDNPGLGWDWTKTDGTSYDIQMFGVTQSSTQAELKKIRKTLKKKGVALAKTDLNTFGTKAVLAYIGTIEETSAAQ
jgi:mono/diheme cytochrome c family protein